MIWVSPNIPPSEKNSLDFDLRVLYPKCVVTSNNQHSDIKLRVITLDEYLCTPDPRLPVLTPLAIHQMRELNIKSNQLTLPNHGFINLHLYLKNVCFSCVGSSKQVLKDMVLRMGGICYRRMDSHTSLLVAKSYKTAQSQWALNHNIEIVNCQYIYDLFKSANILSFDNYRLKLFSGLIFSFCALPADEEEKIKAFILENDGTITRKLKSSTTHVISSSVTNSSKLKHAIDLKQTIITESFLEQYSSPVDLEKTFMKPCLFTWLFNKAKFYLSPDLKEHELYNDLIMLIKQNDGIISNHEVSATYIIEMHSKTKDLRSRTPIWVERCAEENRILSPELYKLYSPTPSEKRRGEYKVSITGFKGKMYSDIVSSLKWLEIQYSPEFRKSMTHLIVNEGTLSTKVDYAEKWGISTVDQNWLFAIAEGSLTSEALSNPWSPMRNSLSASNCAAITNNNNNNKKTVLISATQSPIKKKSQSSQIALPSPKKLSFSPIKSQQPKRVLSFLDDDDDDDDLFDIEEKIAPPQKFNAINNVPLINPQNSSENIVNEAINNSCNKSFYDKQKEIKEIIINSESSENEENSTNSTNNKYDVKSEIKDSYNLPTKKALSPLRSQSQISPKMSNNNKLAKSTLQQLPSLQQTHSTQKVINFLPSSSSDSDEEILSMVDKLSNSYGHKSHQSTQNSSNSQYNSVPHVESNRISAPSTVTDEKALNDASIPIPIFSPEKTGSANSSSSSSDQREMPPKERETSTNLSFGSDHLKIEDNNINNSMKSDIRNANNLIKREEHNLGVDVKPNISQLKEITRNLEQIENDEGLVKPDPILKQTIMDNKILSGTNEQLNTPKNPQNFAKPSVDITPPTAQQQNSDNSSYNYNKPLVEIRQTEILHKTNTFSTPKVVVNATSPQILKNTDLTTTIKSSVTFGHQQNSKMVQMSEEQVNAGKPQPLLSSFLDDDEEDDDNINDILDEVETKQKDREINKAAQYLIKMRKRKKKRVTPVKVQPIEALDSLDCFTQRIEESDEEDNNANSVSYEESEEKIKAPHFEGEDPMLSLLQESSDI